MRNDIAISDVDILVLAESVSSLASAAESLRPMAQEMRSRQISTFKLSPKFRTFQEIESGEFSVNELAAVEYGKVILGRTELEVAIPPASWYFEQAHLSLETRLAYTQRQMLLVSNDRSVGVLMKYFASKILLEVATIGLLTKCLVTTSYTNRVGLYLNLFNLSSDSRIGRTLSAALTIKRNPNENGGESIEAASQFLTSEAMCLGVEPPSANLSDQFWQHHRPLDIRDRQLFSI